MTEPLFSSSWDIVLEGIELMVREFYCPSRQKIGIISCNMDASEDQIEVLPEKIAIHSISVKGSGFDLRPLMPYYREVKAKEKVFFLVHKNKLKQFSF